MKKITLIAILISVLFMYCNKEKITNPQTNSEKNNSSQSVIMKRELAKFPYDSVGILHNEILDYILSSEVDLEDYDEVLALASDYLNDTYGYGVAIDSLIQEDEIIYDYITGINSTIDDSYFIDYISEHVYLEDWEVNYIDTMIMIINDENLTYSKTLDMLDDLENSINNYDGDLKNKLRLLSTNSVFIYSFVYWNEENSKKPTVRGVLTADGLGVMASTSQIITASLFGPWWGVGYAATAAAVASTCAYVASR